MDHVVEHCVQQLTEFTPEAESTTRSFYTEKWHSRSGMHQTTVNSFTMATGVSQDDAPPASTRLAT